MNGSKWTTSHVDTGSPGDNAFFVAGHDPVALPRYPDLPANNDFEEFGIWRISDLIDRTDSVSVFHSKAKGYDLRDGI